MLTIKNISYLLCSSGDRSALIDTDIAFYKNGFPYIPAKRIKGVFRESFQEVLEMLGIEDNALESKIFGKEGNEYLAAGLLQIGNGYLENWEKILLELNKKPISPDDVKSYFTSEISQTTINDEGIAEKRSLRNYRVLNPENTFQCKFLLNDFSTISTKEKEIIEKAVLNMRYMGTRRNRGFGKIKCSIDWEVSNKQKQKNIEAEGFKQLKIELTTRSPIVLTAESLDVNTVATDKIISGNRVRGMLAAEFIKNYPIGGVENNENLHVFQQLFLQKKIKFPYLYLDASIPMPLNLHKEKRSDDKSVVNVFFLPERKITKSVGSFSKDSFLKDDSIIRKSIPSSTYYFHNKRSDRLSGRSTEDSGAIFYYEGLDSSQTFIGNISGEEKAIELFRQHFSESFDARLGRSKSTQYGQVEVHLTGTENNEVISEKNDQYYFVLQSPAILFNSCGEAEPSGPILHKYLKDALGVDIKIYKAATATTFIEQYNNKWNCKTSKWAAFKEGSTFLISGLADVDTLKLNQLIEEGIGEFKEVGYGVLKIIAVDNFPKDVSLADEQNDAILSPVNYSYQLSLLKRIEDHSKKNLNDAIIKNKAISKAMLMFNKNNNNRIAGNLIGRMLDLFQLANQEKSDKEKYEFIENEITEMQNARTNKKPKPAFTSLKRAGLIDIDGNFQFTEDKDHRIPFSEEYLYWKTYFLTMRKLNKMEKNA